VRPDRCVHPWLYARCRELEADPDGHLDLWAREHYKSTLGTFAGVIQEILRNPEITIGVFSHTAPVAKKFMQQVKGELEQNERLKLLFPDILWENPQRDSPLWSIEKGIVVRRATNPKEATVEAHGLVDSQPIGAHFNLLVYDDVVTPASVTTPEHGAEDDRDVGAIRQPRRARRERADAQVALRHALLVRRHLPVDHRPQDPEGAPVPGDEDGTIEGEPVFLTPRHGRRRSRRRARRSSPRRCCRTRRPARRRCSTRIGSASATCARARSSWRSWSTRHRAARRAATAP
jgi:hypothetical protein